MDIRVNVSFINHRKRKKLRMLIGPCATDCLLDLWLSTAMNHPTGVLDGMKPIDIALESNFEGDPETFVSALMDCGLLEYVDGIYQLHDWNEHQAYVITAPARREKARKASAARWGVESNATSMPQACNKDATSMPQAMLDDESSNAKSEVEQCPILFSSLPDSTLHDHKDTYVPSGTTPHHSADFETFWKEYPNKKAKQAALKAWTKNKKTLPGIENLIAILERHKQSKDWTKDGGAYIPHPATWLNRGQWEDEMEKAQQQNQRPEWMKGLGEVI